MRNSVRRRGSALGFTVLLLLFFQNCGSPFQTATYVEPSVETTGSSSAPSIAIETAPMESSPVVTPQSPLVFKSLFEVGVPSCFPERNGGAEINQKTIEYKEVYAPGLNRMVHLRAYVHRPSHRSLKERLPVVVIFHGGGWIGNDPTYWFPLSFNVASQGMVAINFQYRLFNAHQSTPEESVKDALSAVRWVRKNAESLGIDPQRVLVLGDSAGGHLALSTALVQNLSDEQGEDARISTFPQALYTLYPVVLTTGAVMLSLPFSHPDPTLGHPDISPMRLLSSKRLLPPTVLWQGTADASPLNPPTLAKNFCETANALAQGTRCHYAEYLGAGHAFIEEAIGEGAETRGHYQEIAANVFSFLVDLGYMTANKSQLLDQVKNSAEHCRDWTYSRYNAYKQNYGYYPLSQSAW